MKHLRKDDGYVMVYVLIVFTILALVGGSICAMALSNLKAQKADVARMEARYAAEGYLQQFVAELANQTFYGAVDNQPSDEMIEARAQAVAKEKFFDAVVHLAEDGRLIVDADEEGSTITIEAIHGSAHITATMKVEFTWKTADRTDTDGNAPFGCTIEVEDVTFTYVAYDVSYEEVST